MRKSLFAVALVGIISLVMGTRTAQAVIITLTGGDPGEGYAPLPIHVAAYDFANDASIPSALPNQVVQGVTFVGTPLSSLPANVSVTGAASNFEGIADIGPSANDKALTIINKFEFFASPSSGPMVVTIGGLTTGVSYQVDLFVHSNTVRNGDYTIGGALPDNVITANNTSFYDVRETVAAAGGQIVVSVSSTDSSFPFLNALSVTVPEPASMALIGVAAPLLMVRRRRHA